LMTEELAGGRSDMRYSVLRPPGGLRSPARQVKITEFSYGSVKKPQFTMG
jgi:hypothetical protein